MKTLYFNVSLPLREVTKLKLGAGDLHVYGEPGGGIAKLTA